MAPTDTSSVPLEDLASLPEYYHPVVSPDGSQVAFFYDETGRNELYVLEREAGTTTKLTDGEAPKSATWPLRWGPTGDRIFFHRDEDGDEQNDIFAVDFAGTVERVVSVDGQAIFVDATAETVLFGSDAGEQLNLYACELASGEVTQLTHYEQPVFTARYSPSGDRIAYIGNESETLENRDLYRMDADGNNKRRHPIGEDGSETALAGWFPGGEGLLIADNADDLSRVGVYDLTTEQVEWYGPHDHEESAVAVSPDGATILATRDRQAATMPVVYDVETGAGRELDLPEGVVGFYQFRHLPAGGVFADETTVVLSHSQSERRRQCYVYDLATDERDVLIEATYGDVDPAAFVNAEYVDYESEDGLDIGALLFDPREGPARPAGATDVPGVVVVHGGPHGRADRRFNIYVQFLVSQGYAVLQPNYRGSVGQGRAFKHAIHGDWGGKEQADIAAGGRWLQERDWIDADRVAVFGGSYGGYSVYCQLPQYPTLWATGIAWIGITDLHRLFEEDMPHFQHQLLTQMGDPEENYELWRDRSPIEHVDRLERPICIIHGVNDPRCPIEQARIFRDALLERGWEEGNDFEYEELSEEGHASTDIDQKVRVFELFADYLDRRL